MTLEEKAIKFMIGEFGKAHFKIRKKGVQFTGIEAYGTIIDMDAKNVLFKDNDGYEFIVSKARFEFEAVEK